ncbi:MAG: hypothetical protein RLZ83_675 [Pseudomonadota bacterium]|jgi:uncharacterized protein YcnI
MKNPVRMLAAFLAPFAVASTTWGHATFENREVVQNTTVRMVTRVPHGCSGQPTLRVRIAIPEGVVGVKPMPKAGWTLTTKTIQLSQPYESHGQKITTGVGEITWEGKLEDAHYDEFIFRANFTDRLPTGKMLYIPVVQECANGAERWIEIPSDGQSSSDLKYPAPGVKVMPATQRGHGR